MRRLALAAFCGATLLLATGARALGPVDVLFHDADDRIDDIASASSDLNRNGWTINARRMATRRPFEEIAGGRDTLLLGDSLVRSGNGLRTEDRLPPGDLRVFRVRDVTGWTPALYHDSIHPTPQGTSILAEAVAARLAR